MIDGLLSKNGLAGAETELWAEKNFCVALMHLSRRTSTSHCCSSKQEIDVWGHPHSSCHGDAVELAGFHDTDLGVLPWSRRKISVSHSGMLDSNEQWACDKRYYISLLYSSRHVKCGVNVSEWITHLPQIIYNIFFCQNVDISVCISGLSLNMDTSTLRSYQILFWGMKVVTC